MTILMLKPMKLLLRHGLAPQFIHQGPGLTAFWVRGTQVLHCLSFHFIVNNQSLTSVNIVNTKMRFEKKSSIECFGPHVDTLGNLSFEISFSARADVRINYAKTKKHSPECITWSVSGEKITFCPRWVVFNDPSKTETGLLTSCFLWFVWEMISK